MARKSKSVKNEVKKVLDTGFLLSVGVASIAKEKAEELINQLVKKGKLNEKQGKKAVRDLIKKSKKERERVKKILKN